MWRIYIKNHPQFGPVYERVSAQPSWVTRAAIFAGLILFVVPLALLAMAAVLVGTVVFILLATIMRVVTVITNLFGGGGRGGVEPMDDGRENVRVIDRD